MHPGTVSHPHRVDPSQSQGVIKAGLLQRCPNVAVQGLEEKLLIAKEACHSVRLEEASGVEPSPVVACSVKVPEVTCCARYAVRLGIGRRAAQAPGRRRG